MKDRQRALEPPQTLAHYRLLEKIGEGGMGVVYRARDQHLERDVAVKVLPAEQEVDPLARDRFRTEALALSALNHPNIETAHDFDSQDGVDFLVMEYVPGTNLAELLARGPLRERQLVRLGLQLAEGLAAAHQQGILHRDLKPNNLRLTADGRLKILDFGLAKLLAPPAADSRAETLARTRGLVGTAPYMAPEQLRGEEVDERTDLYAAGVVLYEMATGRLPHYERLATALTDAILHRPPVPPRALNSRVSPELERVILKCLDKEPRRRYQSARELGVDLARLERSEPTALPGAVSPGARRWLAAATVLVGLLILVVLLAPGAVEFRDRLRGPAVGGRIESLAVLPLVNLSADPAQQYFVDGMHEALISSLAKIRALRVISRTSAMRYRDSEKPLPEIARELGVDAIVEGSVLWRGERVRITAQLVDAATDSHLWAESYESDLRDVLGLQSDTARAIAREIRVLVTAEDEARLQADQPVDRLAYEAFLKGRHYLNQRTRNEIFLSLDFFRRSIDADPTFALAHVGWAEAAILTGWYGWAPPEEAFPAAKAAAERALALAPESAEAHTMLAGVRMLWDWDYPGAETGFRRAIELDPGYPRAHHWYSLFLTYMARYDEAIAEIQRAQELDPLSIIIPTIAGLSYCQSGRYEEALREAASALERSPDFPLALGTLVCGHLGLRRYDEAIAAARQALAVTGGATELSDLIEAHTLAGQHQRARELVAELEARAEREHVAATTMAATYLIVGRDEEALDWLEKAYDEHSWSLIFLRRKIYDPLRSRPRFQELYRKVGLESALLPPRSGPSLEHRPVVGEQRPAGPPAVD